MEFKLPVRWNEQTQCIEESDGETLCVVGISGHPERKALARQKGADLARLINLHFENEQLATRGLSTRPREERFVTRDVADEILRAAGITLTIEVPSRPS